MMSTSGYCVILIWCCACQSYIMDHNGEVLDNKRRSRYLSDGWGKITSHWPPYGTDNHLHQYNVSSTTMRSRNLLAENSSTKPDLFQLLFNVSLPVYSNNKNKLKNKDTLHRMKRDIKDTSNRQNKAVFTNVINNVPQNILLSNMLSPLVLKTTELTKFSNLSLEGKRFFQGVIKRIFNFKEHIRGENDSHKGIKVNKTQNHRKKQTFSHFNTDYSLFTADYEPNYVLANILKSENISTRLKREIASLVNKLKSSSTTNGRMETASSRLQEEEIELPAPSKTAWPVRRVCEVPGDLLLGGLMMVHERSDTVTCGPVMPQGGIQVRTLLSSQFVRPIYLIMPSCYEMKETPTTSILSEKFIGQNGTVFNKMAVTGTLPPFAENTVPYY